MITLLNIYNFLKKTNPYYLWYVMHYQNFAEWKSENIDLYTLRDKGLISINDTVNTRVTIKLLGPGYIYLAKEKGKTELFKFLEYFLTKGNVNHIYFKLTDDDIDEIKLIENYALGIDLAFELGIFTSYKHNLIQNLYILSDKGILLLKNPKKELRAIYHKSIVQKLSEKTQFIRNNIFFRFLSIILSFIGLLSTVMFILEYIN